MADVDLTIHFCGVKFMNPYMLAASPSTDNRDMIARGFDAGWAGAVLKTTSVESDRVDIAYPIISSLRAGTEMVGLHNIDLISARRIDCVASDVTWLKEHYPAHRVVISIVGSSKEEWKYLVRRAEDAGADLVELSISCPQGSMLEGEIDVDGAMISQDARLTEKITRWATEAANHIPIYVKLTASVTNLGMIACAVERGGGQGVCVMDSQEGIVGIDLENYSPLPSVKGNGSRGGYSGQAIKPIALKCIADVAQSVKIPISGVGGVYTWSDGLEFLMLGASTIQVCTGVMHHGFGLITDLLDGMERWLASHNFHSPEEIIGLSLSRLKENEDLARNIVVRSNIDQSLCVHCGLCYVACRDGGHEAIDFDTHRIVNVDCNKCVGCGLCEQVCPIPGCIAIQSN